ncbi:MAG: GGDEF domain-containing protein [Gammaproteobacteria bacterium]|nr:MAG: GGDEF domain-containing protein [Gammaproteobacteria bacterium]
MGHITGLTFPLDTLLASDDLGSVPGRMTTQSALFFSMLGLSAICEGKQRPFCTLLRDLLAALLISLLLTVIAGYLFGASELFVQAEDIRTSPQTLVCMTCLAGALLIIRMHHGYFAILAGIGIGSQIARSILPAAVLLPFLIISSSVWLSEGKKLSPVLASSLTAAFSAAVLFVMLIWLSQKINAMESELRDISLIDELTRINNRRGFYLLGEHMLFEAQRDGRPVTVLFFDLDGLKELNDSQGHDIGSDLLKHFASLLREHFRKSDVVARLGGDEFAVVSSSGDSQIALKRLERIINAINKAGKRPYNIRYSVGEATYTSDSPITDFNALVSAADERMYESKRNKKATHRAKTTTATQMASTAN